MKEIHRNIVYLKSKKLDRRNMAETYCQIADTLEPKKVILFCLYYLNGYSTVQIGEFMGLANTTVGRRINHIKKEIEGILGNRVGTQSPQPTRYYFRK